MTLLAGHGMAWLSWIWVIATDMLWKGLGPCEVIEVQRFALVAIQGPPSAICRHTLHTLA